MGGVGVLSGMGEKKTSVMKGVDGLGVFKKSFWLPRSGILRVLEEGRKNDIGSGVLGMPYRKKLDPMSIQPPN